MPRYFFNVYEQVGMIDTVGIEVADTRAARKEAIRYAGSMLADGAFVNELDLDWRMEVTNSSGLILFRLDFLLTIAPAATEMKFELASRMSP